MFNNVSCPVYINNDTIDNINITDGTNSRPDCELFYDFGFNQYGCVKCKWGKTGNKIIYATPTSSQSSLGICELMDGCNVNV